VQISFPVVRGLPRMSVRVAVALLLGVPTVTLAQVANVTTSVEVEDGAPAARQRVTLSNPATGFAADAVTNAQGQAHFAAVPAGEGYVVVIDGQTLSTDIRLRANETRTLALALPVAVGRRHGNESMCLPPTSPTPR
jgi:hypothetical protein